MDLIEMAGGRFPLVSICIPTFDVANGRAAQLIDSIGRTTPPYYEIIVKDCHGRVDGYTKPMNAAMARGQAPFLVAVNDDIQLADGWLQWLLTPFLNDAGIWCVTPDATHTDGPQVFHPWLMVWRAEAWRSLGGLDERFVHWCSDIDIARRMVDCGHPPVKVKLPMPVTHDLNATSNELPELGPICTADLIHFQQKWGVDAEYEKHRLAGLI